MIKNEDIICITLSDWDEPKRCRHHLMGILAKSNRVLFVERPVNVLKLFNTASEWKRLAHFFRGIRHRQEQLYLVTAPPIIPGGDWSLLINQINQALITLHLRVISFFLRLRDPILWIFAYNAGGQIGRLKEKISIYYCNDPFAAFAPDGKKKNNILAVEKQLVEKADLVFAVSDELVREKSRWNGRTYLSEHAVHSSLLNYQPGRAREMNINRPRIGYLGTLNADIDYELLRYLAVSRPEWNLVIVGPVQEIEMDNKSREDLRSLLKLANVRYLGGKDQAELPDYYDLMDVFLFPYINQSLDVYTNVPLKTYEYFAFGKPIVSINDYPRFKHFDRGLIRIADNKESFVSLVGEALSEISDKTSRLRKDLAYNNTWEMRLAFISQKVADSLGSRKK